MAKSDDIFQTKIDFIEVSEDRLKGKISKAERYLLSELLTKVIPSLSKKDGVIEFTTSNVIAINKGLESIFKQFDKTINLNIVKSLLSDFNNVSKLNTSYFSVVSEVDPLEFKDITKNVKNLMQQSLGYTAKGKIKPNTFIANLTKSDFIKTSIRESVIRGVQQGLPVKDLMTELRSSILTNDDGLGVMNKYYNEIVRDKYSEFERAESKAYAGVLGMTAFIYAGGKVQDTRTFCCQRNTKVFLREETDKWRGMKWQGKNKNYNPLIDLGGYQCRHSTQWITNQSAMRKRSDLKEDSNGKLVIDKTKAKQKLNSCK